MEGLFMKGFIKTKSDRELEHNFLHNKKPTP